MKFTLRRDEFIVTAYDDRGQEVRRFELEQEIADSRDLAFALATQVQIEDPSLTVWVADTAKNTRTRVR